MSEHDIPQTESEVAESPAESAEPSYDDLIARAAEALAGADEEESGEPTERADAAPEQAPDAADEAEAAPEPDSDAEASEGSERAEEEPSDEGDKDKPPPWQFAQLRRQQKQLERERNELQKLADELRPLKDDLSAMPDPRRDPLGYMDWAAGRAGMTPAQLYELATHRQLKDGQPDPSAEVAAIRDELAALKAEREKERLAAEERQKAVEAQELLQADVAGVSQAVGQYAKAWPKARLERESRAAVQWAYENAPDMTYDAIGKALESMARDEYNSMHKTLSGSIATAEDRDTSKARDGQGTPDAAASKPAGSQKPRSTLTNNDAAHGGATHRELSDEERYRLAGQALDGSV